MSDDEADRVKKKIRQTRADDNGTTQLLPSKNPESESDAEVMAGAIYHKVLRPCVKNGGDYVSLLKHLVARAVTVLEVLDYEEVNRYAKGVAWDKKASAQVAAEHPELNIAEEDKLVLGEFRKTLDKKLLEERAKAGELFGNILDTFELESGTDFQGYAQRIYDTLLKPFETNVCYVSLLKHLMGLSLIELSADDAKHVVYFVDRYAYQQLHEEREAKAGRPVPAGGKKDLMLDGMELHAMNVTSGCDCYDGLYRKP